MKKFDISLNYINGTIPPERDSLPLLDMYIGSFDACRILEFNELFGDLPQELEYLTSNNFSGDLHGTLAKLTTLKDFWIGDNFFTGSIPNFIQNWIHLETFGLDGPIPSSIAFLTNMTDLRISDLNGSKVSNFPSVGNMTKLIRLMLKNLSFNKLSGEIPSNLHDLSTLNSICYLTGNLLNGSVLTWMLDSKLKVSIDLSYNNLSSSVDSVDSFCQSRQSKLNWGKRVLEDFNIEHAAGGVDFHPSSVSGNGSIVGIVTGVVFAVFLMLGILWWKGCLQHNNMMEHVSNLKGLELPTGSFTLRQIKAATKNFDFANKIEESGFGLVTVIAVKQLSSKLKHGNCEFVNEIGMISALQHPNLVKLYGCCIEGKQLLLVYKYMENNSLARALFGPEEHQLTLNWPTRHRIYIGIAKGLAYLHESTLKIPTRHRICIGIAKGLTYLHESTLKIVHRDIKAVNVLLDKNLNPKISDFGLAKLDDEEENAHISTRRIMGTRGYMAPKYAMWGYLTNKADVYSFKVVALEIVCGRHATSSYRRNEDSFNLLELGLDLKEKGNLMELVDQRLESDCNKEQVMVMLNVVLLCTNATAAIRPTMSSVVSMLEGKANVQSFSIDGIKPKKTDNRLQYSAEMSTSNSHGHDISTDRPWTDSKSAFDLYPLKLSS
ncbi:unnamed protein product [Camellia sinensis]